MYRVKEIFYSIQGEGARAGRAAVFCRFSGCNLWSGREEDRQAAACSFCDTDFVGTDGPGGGKYNSPDQLADRITSLWPSAGRGQPYVVFTGGEPLLQLDAEVIEAVTARGFEVGVETNGTRPVPAGVHWITVSPKPGKELVLRSGNEIKLVFPQTAVSPSEFEELDFSQFYLQPMDGPLRDQYIREAVNYCLAHPMWKLSLQLHKIVGVP